MNFNEYSLLMSICLGIYAVKSLAEAWGGVL